MASRGSGGRDILGARLMPRQREAIARSATPTLIAAGISIDGGMFTPNSIPAPPTTTNAPKKFGDPVVYYSDFRWTIIILPTHTPQ